MDFTSHKMGPNLEKIYIFSDIKINFTYTQSEYWLSDFGLKIKEVFNQNFDFTKNVEIVNFKKKLQNEIDFLNNEMGFVNFSQESILNIITSVKNNFFPELNDSNLEKTKIFGVKNK